MKQKLQNSLWMIIEKLVAVFGLMFVTSFVAKYVGPVTFGVIAISMLIFQFIQSVAMMGCDVILLKRIAQNHRSGIRLMVPAVILVFSLYCVLSTIGIVVMREEMNSQAFVFICAAALACLFSAIDLVNIYNEAVLNAKLNVMANLTGLLISLAIRYGISWFQLKPELLAIPIVLATFIPFLIKLCVFSWHQRRTHEKPPLPRLTHIRRYSGYILQAGRSLVLSVIAITIYTRLNQLSVSWFLGLKEAGIFSVAMTLSVAWVFLPNALLASFYPALFAERDPDVAIVRAQKLQLMVIAVSGAVIGGIALIGPWFIRHFYGAAYTEAIAPMVLLSIGAMFGVLSSVMDRFIIKYNGYRYLIKKTFCVLAVCLITTVTLVPAFGITGGAISVVITEFMAFTLLNYFFRGQPMMKIHKIFIQPGKLWFLINRSLFSGR
ncbi:O-antigen/teichoic acid export membrane protein [Pantoea sp. PNA 14-12]|uniref:oligosaccharide flippase family protein n=1 Tax=Pantoea TaxID=53335 RepID=UPI0005422C09|nr:MULTISPECIES: oligosaccharide flippase family protein [Pantoea]KHE02720.1 hypothetical protein NL54_03595 [Pantoea stewartii]KHN64594.1 hypothetical protein OI73_06180 [Pantoea stewartii]KTS26620.1 hypothetical protein NS381_16745 [Pantoea stewartii]MBC0854993.1 oligosaccharide flippase family protein [Pantoea stewartii]MCU7367792.1 oligosaccharide flippase family protein [Pantoea stewartii]